MTNWIGFNRENVRRSPQSSGAYALADSQVVIYYGRADNIHARLLQHLSGSEGVCTQSATWFAYELSSNPALLEQQLLQQYRRQHGTLPRCNDVMP